MRLMRAVLVCGVVWGALAAGVVAAPTWNGLDPRCEDLTMREAQAIYDDPTYNQIMDPYDLDPDGNMVACEQNQYGWQYPVAGVGDNSPPANAYGPRGSLPHGSHGGYIPGASVGQSGSSGSTGSTSTGLGGWEWALRDDVTPPPAPVPTRIVVKPTPTPTKPIPTKTNVKPTPTPRTAASSTNAKPGGGGSAGGGTTRASSEGVAQTGANWWPGWWPVVLVIGGLGIGLWVRRMRATARRYRW